MSISPAPVLPSLEPAETSIVMTGLVATAAVILWPQPTMRRSLPPELVVLPMVMFSVVSVYMPMMSLSADAVTAAWSEVCSLLAGRTASSRVPMGVPVL